MKKVSWASRAGCDCGWKSESKFQNEDSTNWFVGISSNPMPRRILRNSARTFMRGCKNPPLRSAPKVFRLAGRKSKFFQASPSSISFVKSATCFLNVVEKRGPFFTTRDVTLTSLMSFRFFRSLAIFAGTAAVLLSAGAASIARNCSTTSSFTSPSTRRVIVPVALSCLIQRRIMHFAIPKRAKLPHSCCRSLSSFPSGGTAARKRNSGLPFWR
mmetsp:Transcript_34187/g.50244  ORF Transcript_34187/g.50244 Transcript_34187/m.50244 type:complete len:214 (+) Transcript_34187:729-1370(+)